MGGAPTVSTVTRKGQVTIPREVRQQLDLRPTDKVEIWAENGEARLRKARGRTLREVAGSLPAPKMPLEEAIKQAKRDHAEDRARGVIAHLAQS
jgi:AbrB family looped-hinge helix DNA binding protein